MNQKIEKLLERGIEPNTALLICFDFLSDKEKEELTFKECQDLLLNTPSDSLQNEEVLGLVISKAESLEQYYWIWENTFSDDEPEELWGIVKAKAKTLEQCYWLWKKIPQGITKDAEVLQLLKNKAIALFE